MRQDLRAGRKTAVGCINGAVFERGALCGIDTPVNRTIRGLIQFRESLSGRA